MLRRNNHKYTPIFEVKDGESSEIHFALRDDGVYIISRCQVLKGGEKIYMRSSVTLKREVAEELGRQLVETFQ